MTCSIRICEVFPNIIFVDWYFRKNTRSWRLVKMDGALERGPNSRRCDRTECSETRGRYDPHWTHVGTSSAQARGSGREERLLSRLVVETAGRRDRSTRRPPRAFLCIETVHYGLPWHGPLKRSVRRPRAGAGPGSFEDGGPSERPPVYCPGVMWRGGVLPPGRSRPSVDTPPAETLAPILGHEADPTCCGVARTARRRGCVRRGVAAKAARAADERPPPAPAAPRADARQQRGASKRRHPARPLAQGSWLVRRTAIERAVGGGPVERHDT